ncbi:MAG: F0F1 ATP synthase subunit delta [Bacteroidaceae bacterium]|nr:F0F1 ATP synthase subunit delta [Bacteroidaceae bacterium]
MNVGTISMRYARALLSFATEHDAEDVIYGNMSQLVHTLDKIKELPVLLRAPVLTPDERVEIICEAVGGNGVFEQFARLVVKEEREELLLFIAHCYMTLYRKAKGLLSVSFTTATPISDAFLSKVQKLIEQSSGAKVELNNIVDHSIIGGFIYEANSVRLDASVKGQLDGIRKKMVEQNRKLV